MSASTNQPRRLWRIGLSLLLPLAVLGCGYAVWSRLAAPTRIALVNYKDFQLNDLYAANKTEWVRLDRLETADLAKRRLGTYDAIYLFGRGLNLDPAQRADLERAMAGGTKLYVDNPTNPANDFTNLSAEQKARVSGYLDNGGPENLASLLAYTRSTLDGKSFFLTKAAEPARMPTDYLFTPGEGRRFDTVAAYEEQYKKQGSFRAGKPRVAVLTSMFGPLSTYRDSVDAVLQAIEAKQINVYPIAGMGRRLDLLREVKPDLVVYIPHGRLAMGRGDETVDYLKQQGIPVLCPIHVLKNHDEWLKDQKGLEGGMLSQTIVTPELDGGIEPYTTTTQRPNERGFEVPWAVPERVQTFASRVEHWLRLRATPNSEKKLAIVYFKEPGQNAMVAAGMEVVPSLWNLLKSLKESGYDTGELPATPADLEALVHTQGAVLGPYAKGKIDEFVNSGHPELIERDTYLGWAKKDLQPELVRDVEASYGPAPGEYLATEKDGKSYIAIPRIQFGKVVILPQLLPAIGDDTNKLIHGARKAPPYPYIATYLWAREGFQADALIHFGTHGSLEFTPWKQSALSSLDWPDALIGDLPHVYIYVINNVGEAVIAKRRSYATIVSYLTPPFMEAELHGPLKQVLDAVSSYNNTADEAVRAEIEKTIRRQVLEQKLQKDIGIELSEATPLTADQIEQLHEYLFHVAQQKITHGLYTLGQPYSPQQIDETARVMAIDAVATARANLDVLNGKADRAVFDQAEAFADRYRNPASRDLTAILAGTAEPLSLIDGADTARLDAFRAREESRSSAAAGRPSAAAMAAMANMPAAARDAMMKAIQAKAKAAASKAAAAPPEPESERQYCEAVATLREALTSVTAYRQGIADSTRRELDVVTSTLSGHYVAPSPGGDAITTPGAIPTGRNLISIDAERAPSPEACRVAANLAQATIDAKRKEKGEFPKKVAITLWSGDFINGQGVEIAMAFDFLGIEPVRDARGVVHDVRLIPADRLTHPRIDVVVQTSGQFRDIAASRLALIDKAVKIAAAAEDPAGTVNNVREGTVAAERKLKEQGLSPAEAQKLATTRVFGGLNGGYGTGIMGLVEAGDRWRDASEIGQTYLNNMGAAYTGDQWGSFTPGLLNAALQNTDTLLHARTSNQNGPLSLDHVYEFMGGMNAAIQEATGHEPDALFADMRNKHQPRMQGAKEAIWAEARSTLLNPKYITALRDGGASSAAVFAESMRNTYGWNATRPSAIDKELWDDLHDVYVRDSLGLGLRQSFEAKNPFAYEELTAVMLESARKGLWKASPEQLRELSGLHVELVEKHSPGCSGFVCDNAPLREFIGSQVAPASAARYASAIDAIRAPTSAAGAQAQQKGVVLKRVDPQQQEQQPSADAATPPGKAAPSRTAVASTPAPSRGPQLIGGGVALAILALFLRNHLGTRSPDAL
jgi:cobaltochelatase CobN